jgi:hypothetical protein
VSGPGKLFLLAMVAGCSVAAADHERLGDEAYRAGRFEKALGEYQAAQRTGARSRIWAKAAAAALGARDFSAAADAWSELAREDPTRALEAAIGLGRVAALAEEEGPSGAAAVAKAVLALRALDPARPLGRVVGATLAGQLEPTEELGLLPAAIAAAETARGVDSLLLRYADAQRATVACDAAARSYRSLLRRTSDSRLRSAGRSGLADCALLLGQDALVGRDGSTAERWFETVLGIETETARAWSAQIGVGDARMLQGDALGAAVAYQAVVSSAGVADSLRGVAAAKLNGLGTATPTPPAE